MNLERKADGVAIHKHSAQLIGKYREHIRYMYIQIQPKHQPLSILVVRGISDFNTSFLCQRPVMSYKSPACYPKAI